MARERTRAALMAAIGCMLAVTSILAVFVGAPASAAPSLGRIEPQQIVNLGGDNIQQPSIAVGDDGTAVTTWRQIDGSVAYVWASRSSPGSPWTSPVRVSPYMGANYPGVPHVVAGPSGTFLAVWPTTSSSATSFTYSWYKPATGWADPAPVSVTPGHQVISITLCADALGNAYAMIMEFAAADANLSAVRYTAGVGWGSLTLLETLNEFIDYSTVHCAADASGNAVAVWTQSVNTWQSMFTNRYTPATGWTGAVDLENDLARAHSQPSITSTASGQYVVAWQSNPDVYVNTYTPGSGWAGAVPLYTPANGTVGGIFVGMVGAQALVSWVWANGSNYEMRATTGIGSTWQPYVLLSGASSPNYNTQASSESAGTAVVAWQESGGIVKVSRYVAGEGWSVATRLYDLDTGLGLSNLACAMGPSGDAAFVWYQSSGGYTVSALRIRESVAPPLSVSAPAEAASTANASIAVTGTTEPGARVEANGVAATVDAQGNFAALVPLKAGANTLTIVARDAAGNERTSWRNVTFNDPTPALVSDLAAAQAQVAALSAQMADAEAQLAATNASLAVALRNLSAAQASLSALESNASTSQADLAAARANLTAANARVLALEAAQVSLVANLTALQSDLDLANDRIAALEDRPAGGDSGLALILAAVAIAVGFAGLAAALVMGGRGGKVSRAPTVKGASRVENPSASSGGSDAETTSEGKERAPEPLSRRDR